MSHYELDATGLLCPMPVIRTQDRVQELNAGDHLKVVCTDPGAVNDVPAWTRINGHKVIDIQHQDNLIIIEIEVKP